MPLKSIIDKHNRFQDSMLHAFEQHLREITMRAQGRTIAKLQAKLSITNGVIDSSAGNMLALRNAGKVFMREMELAGYTRLVDAFVGEFRGTLPFLNETLELLGDQVGEKWGELGFTAKDLSLLGGVQANTVAGIESAIATTAGAAIQRGLFGVAGLRFGSLVEMLSKRFEMSIGKATSIGNTAMSSWYRTASDRRYRIIEEELPQHVLLYVYQGPDDRLTRQYCEDMLKRTRKMALTREQINQYPNGQLLNPFITCGGYCCRHGYYISTKDLILQMPGVAA